MTPLPISTITKVFHPRIVPTSNALISELRITELFYYGFLLPNVAHSLAIESDVTKAKVKSGRSGNKKGGAEHEF